MDLFRKLVELKEALVSAIQTRNADAIRKAWTAFTKVGDIIFGPHDHEAVEGAKASGDVAGVVEEIKACCKTVQTEAAADADGRWAVLAQIVQFVLPYILKWFAK